MIARLLSHIDRVAVWEGSTRTVGVLRAGLALLVWAEHGPSLSLLRGEGLFRHLVGAALLVSAGAMAAGWFARFASATTAVLLGITYFGFGLIGGERGAFVHAHCYLLWMAITLVALAPNDRSLSADRLLGRVVGPEHGALWPLALIRLQLALVYFWGAIDKTTPAFLSGTRLQQVFMRYLGSHEWPSGLVFEVLAAVAAWTTVALEYGMAFGLWFPRARRLLIPAGVAFHAAIYLSLPVGTFSALTVLLYLAFLPPDAVHRAIDRLVGSPALGR